MLLDDPIKALIMMSLVLVVTACALTDVLNHRIPNIILLPALLLALLLNSLLAGIPGLLDSILGLAVGMAMLFPFYFVGGTSAGDVKLLGVAGALLGMNGALIAGVASLVFGGALGVLFIAWRFIKPILTFHTQQLVNSNEPTGLLPIRASIPDRTDESGIPYAPAIAFGSYYSLWSLGYFSGLVG